MDILKYLYDERIFSVELSEDKRKLSFVEQCDSCFEVELGKTGVDMLIHQLKELSDQMINEDSEL